MKRRLGELAYVSNIHPGAFNIYPPGSVISGADPFLDTTGRVEVSSAIDPNERTGVFVVVGQSLSVNCVPGPYTVSSGKCQQLNIYDGKLYETKEPMLGINFSGGGGSTWMSRFQDQLIADDYFDRPIIVPMAVGNTSVAMWASNTTPPYLRNLIEVVGLRLREAKLPCTAILWGLGETDTSLGTSQAAYAGSLQQVIAAFNIAIPRAPIFVDLESQYYSGPSAAVRAAQAGSWNGVTVFAGADVDTIGSGGRYDGVHLNATGASQRASLTVAAVAAALGL